MLNQALLGEVSPNFRMVELSHDGGGWVITITLAEDRAEDRNAIEDICDDMSVYLMDLQGRISRAAEAGPSAMVVISREPLTVAPSSTRRPVFLMRRE